MTKKKVMDETDKYNAEVDRHNAEVDRYNAEVSVRCPKCGCKLKVK